MINDQLRAVIDRALDRERISAEDVRELQREVFKHGLTCREEVNVLAALDRAVPTADPLWAKFFVASLVEFVVWTSRPTGTWTTKPHAGSSPRLCRWTGPA
jgi:hypothetical protein